MIVTNLKHQYKECVEIATIVDGKILHGHAIPRDCRKVMLDAIKPGLTFEWKDSRNGN